MRHRWAWLWVAVACGGGSDGDTGAAPFRFDDLGDEEKFAYMASDVLPAMAEVFRSYDPDTYAEVSCGTCHVAGAIDGSYAMPDPGLPPLREEDFPYTDDIGVFMEDEVLPAIAELLGPTDGGRPCVTCHPLEE